MTCHALDWNAKTVAEFRANESRAGGTFEGASLAQLIITAAERSRLIVVSRSQPLISTMQKLAGPGSFVNTIELAKHSAQTLVVGQEPLEASAWQRPKR